MASVGCRAGSRAEVETPRSDRGVSRRRLTEPSLPRSFVFNNILASFHRSEPFDHGFCRLQAPKFAGATLIFMPQVVRIL